MQKFIAFLLIVIVVLLGAIAYQMMNPPQHEPSAPALHIPDQHVETQEDQPITIQPLLMQQSETETSIQQTPAESIETTGENAAAALTAILSRLRTTVQASGEDAENAGDSMRSLFDQFQNMFAPVLEELQGLAQDIEAVTQPQNKMHEGGSE